MTVRLKMRCDAVEKNDEGCGTVRLYPVIGNSPENDEFFRQTPSGKLEMGTVNANAIAQFTVGDEYYVDISSAAVPEVIDPPVELVDPHPSETEDPPVDPPKPNEGFPTFAALVQGSQEPFVAAPLTPLDGTENGQLAESAAEGSSAVPEETPPEMLGNI